MRARSCSGSRATTRAGSVVPSCEADAQRVDVVDDVVVGDDVAARIDDDAGAHAVDAVLGRRRRRALRSRSRASVTVRSLWMLTTDALTRSTTSTAVRTAAGCPGPRAWPLVRPHSRGKQRDGEEQGGRGPERAAAGDKGRRPHGDPRAVRRAGAGVVSQSARVPQAHGSAGPPANLHPARLATARRSSLAPACRAGQSRRTGDSGGRDSDIRGRLCRRVHAAVERQPRIAREN